MLAEPRRACARALLGAVLLLGAGCTEPERRPVCLTPAAEQTLRELMSGGKLGATLGSLTLVGVSVGASDIVLRTQDAGGRQHAVTLQLHQASDRTPDERGEQFAFYLESAPGADDKATAGALLATARLIDEALPETALGDCGGRRESDPKPLQAQVADRRHASRAYYLASAVVQILAVVAAAIYGWRAISAPRP